MNTTWNEFDGNTDKWILLPPSLKQTNNNPNAPILNKNPPKFFKSQQR